MSVVSSASKGNQPQGGKDDETDVIQASGSCTVWQVWTADDRFLVEVAHQKGEAEHPNTVVERRGEIREEMIARL